MLQRWRDFKAEYLGKHPLCAKCMVDGQRRFASRVLHTVVHAGDPAVMFDAAKARGVCAGCAKGLGVRDAPVSATLH